MGKRGLCLSYNERLEIERLLRDGLSASKIAKSISRSANAVAVEIRRCGGREIYNAKNAQERYDNTRFEKYEALSERNKGLYFGASLKERVECLEMQMEILNDIINLNISKKWSQQDYLNYYVKHNNVEYITLQNFMKERDIGLRVCLGICGYSTHADGEKFRTGQFVFDKEKLTLDYSCCNETVSIITRINGYSPYTKSSRFWKALICLIRHPYFDPQKWFSNVTRLTSNFCAKATTKDYKAMMFKVHNHGHGAKINIDLQDE